jgi:hypothetical protein
VRHRGRADAGAHEHRVGAIHLDELDAQHGDIRLDTPRLEEPHRAQRQREEQHGEQRQVSGPQCTARNVDTRNVDTRNAGTRVAREIWPLGEHERLDEQCGNDNALWKQRLQQRYELRRGERLQWVGGERIRQRDQWLRHRLPDWSAERLGERCEQRQLRQLRIECPGAL